MAAERVPVDRRRDETLDRSPHGIDHLRLERAHCDETSTRSSVDGQHPESRPGYHDDRWMVTPPDQLHAYPRGSKSQRVAAAKNSGMANSNRSCWARLVCSLTQRSASSPLMAPVCCAAVACPTIRGSMTASVNTAV